MQKTNTPTTLQEAERIMTICNACRYCEGHCAVFPAMELRLGFAQADLEYMANLCHGCGSCYHHCQYAEPHEFTVNVPRTFAELRRNTYADYAWPRAFGTAFERNGVWVALLTCLALVGFIVGTALVAGPERFLSAHENGFYGVIPHTVMAGLFIVVSLVVLVALVMGVVNYSRALGLPDPFGIERGHVVQAVHDALTLKYLDGGGDGCTYPTETPSFARRTFHHLTFYGFLMCFASTNIGTIYHYVFGWEAPYGLLSLPKLFGIPGGIGLLIGPAGLLWLRSKTDYTATDPGSAGMTVAFLVLLFLTSASGLLLMVFGGTWMVGPALAVHLGVVFALFLSMPYGKFAHGFYRLLSLVAYAMEHEQRSAVVGRAIAPPSGAPYRALQTGSRA